MTETLSAPRSARCAPGAPVNLELPLRAGDRLGGHVVQGHVDGTGTVVEVRPEGFSRVLEIEVEPRLRAISWRRARSRSTASASRSARSRERGFAVSLIPETLQRTELGRGRGGG